MSDQEQERKTALKLSQPGKLELKKTVETGQVRQSFSHGRSKTVTVEVKQKRTFAPGAGGVMREVRTVENARDFTTPEPKPSFEPEGDELHLTKSEIDKRARVLAEAKKAEEEAGARRAEQELLDAQQAALAAKEAATSAIQGEISPSTPVINPQPVAEAEPITKTVTEAALAKKGDEGPSLEESTEKPKVAMKPGDVVIAPATMTSLKTGLVAAVVAPVAKGQVSVVDDEEEISGRVKRSGAGIAVNKLAPVKRLEPRRSAGKLSITSVLEDDEREERGRSLASVRRARERERQKQAQKTSDKVIREVIIPESIMVQELANRMAERSVDVIKCLMRMGVMVTINHFIDADTAELVVAEFGHNFKRVADADVLTGLSGEQDLEEQLVPRPPVVTVMGHVDHGKTSLLDALRSTDVALGEAGGITQHIGAYQVTMKSGAKITFIDTPGHEAFTAMRARGAQITDIVILVVAADDGIMPQTIEAIRHAKAAKVPIIVAINKIDKPDADVGRIRQELLQHELVTEELGGDILAVEVSAKKKLNLEKLEEAILLQAEILDLKANPERSAVGAVVEAKMEKGRGPVVTLLVQKGVLRVGDICIAGAEWGKVRALTDDRGQRVNEAYPSMPVEVLGLNGVPDAGDDFVQVGDEARAREIVGYRQRQIRDAKAKAGQRGTLEQMFSAIKAGEAREMPVVIKGDVQGSVEALVAMLGKIGNETVKMRILHAAVGAVNESDIILARASGGIVIGFNVRANNQARDLARRDNVDIRYYSIIYDVSDDMKKILSGLLAPTLTESFLGYAEIRQVFSVAKSGKIAGCMVTEGVVKRGAKVRLLRDNVVIHQGELSQLKRFKDDVREVREGYECGISFANYDDIREKDMIECFEVLETAGTF